MIFFPEETYKLAISLLKWKKARLIVEFKKKKIEMISHFSTFECFGFDHREITQTLLPVMKLHL